MHSFGGWPCCRATTHDRRPRHQSLFLVGHWRGVWHTPSSFSREELASLHSLVGARFHVQTKENLMQKKLLGMAVAAALAAPAVALAQSAVQVYGTIHLSFGQSQFSNVPAAAGGDVTKFAVNSAASNWGIRSTETLGGGMTAWLQMEFNAQMERRNSTTSNGAIPNNGEGSFRNSGLGLRGNFGNVYLGTWETP